MARTRQVHYSITGRGKKATKRRYGKRLSDASTSGSDRGADISRLRRLPTDELRGDGTSGLVRRSSPPLAANSDKTKAKAKRLSKTQLSISNKSSSGRSLKQPLSNKKGSSAGKNTFAGNDKSVIEKSPSFKNSRLQKSASLANSESAKKSGQPQGKVKTSTIAGLTSHQAAKMMKNAKKISFVKKPSASSKKYLTKKLSQETPSADLESNTKKLWFPKDAFLAVRTPKKDDFYLCRTRMNVYNYTKDIKVNWFIKKAKKCKIQNGYKIGYRDTIETSSVLMQVELIRLSRVTYQLSEDQLEDIKKLLTLAQDVESGNKTLDLLDDDVEQVLLIEPPVPKKPKLKKTASQKLRDQERRSKKREARGEEKKPRQRKTKSGEEPKRKKAVRKSAVLELHPKPDIAVLPLDPLFETREYMPYVSKVANSRLIYRAINLKDNKLLEKLLKDGSKIFELFSKSLDNEENPAMAAAKANDKNILLTLLEEFFGKKFKDRRQNNSRDKTFLGKLDTGSYNRRSLGIKFIRKITASRGSREGNNAFMQNENLVSYDGEDFLKDFLRYNTEPDLLKIMEQFFEKQNQELYSYLSAHNVPDLLLMGQSTVAGKLVKAEMESTYSKTFNHLFRDVLLFTNEELTGCSPSNLRFISKRVQKLSVFHCAAANSNSKYLEKILSVQPDIHIADNRGNRPIHYAAASCSSDNLRLLLDKGANFNDTNSRARLPLHIAVDANRPMNVKLLLEEAKKYPEKDPFFEKFGTGGVNRCDNMSRSPLHIAADEGFLEVAEILLKFGADVNAKKSVSQNQVTPLMCAAANGNLEMVQLLIQHGALVEQKDRMERRAVIHACKNGSTKVLSYLLNLGANPEYPDSSGNSPLHYAAAYGWYFTVKLLLEAGVDPNASNMWKLTPLSVAYLKSHIGVVQLLLSYDKVDINFVDDNGKTLLFHACESDLLQTDLEEQIKFIIEEKGALCNIKDNCGQTPMHCLASNQVKLDEVEKGEKEKAKNEAFKRSVAIAELLIKHGCDPAAVDEVKNSAGMVAISNVANLPLCEFLLTKGSPILLPDSAKPCTSLLHDIADSLWVAPANLDKLIHLIKHFNHLDALKSMANYVDDLGFTPLQKACVAIKNCPMTRYSEIEERKMWKENWDHVRSFIRLLVNELGSDLNAKVQKKHFEDDEMPKPNSKSWWYSEDTAGRTAAHIIMLENDPQFDKDFNIVGPTNSGQIFKDLVRCGTDINVLDHSGNSPLTTCIQKDALDLIHFMATEGKCNLNQKVKYDEEHDAPLILAARRFEQPAYGSKSNFGVICKLIECGCDLNCQTFDTNKTVLHCIISRSDTLVREEILKIVEKLAEKKFNFNTVDGKQRTAMHYALKSNNGGLNQSYELEVKLIQLGTDLGLKDKYGRTALHYIFKKPKSSVNTNLFWSGLDTPSSDPAELTKLIGRNMTVLQINEADRYGQTVLHLAAKNGATNCCMYLTLVGAAVNMKDKDGNTALALAVQNKHDSCATTLIQAGANLKSNVVIIAQEDTAAKEARKKLKQQEAETSLKGINYKKEEWQWAAKLCLKVDEPVRVLSLFQAAIEFDLPGVAMFVTEASLEKSGLTQQDAITIALKSCKYNIALRLLCTTTDTSVLHCKTEHKRNLLHVLALSGADYKQKIDPVIVKIAEFLLKAGLSATEGDEYNCNPILYAVLNRLFSLADCLADQSNGYDVKYTDSFKRSYLAAVIWRCHSCQLDQPCWDFIEKLTEAKVNLNQHFDLPLNPDLATVVKSDKKQDPDYWQSYPNVKTTALGAAICCAAFNITHNLLKWGANPNMADGNGITPLMYAIKLVRTNHIRQLLNHDYDPTKSYKDELTHQKDKPVVWKKSSRALFNVKSNQEESNESSEVDDESNDENSENNKDKDKCSQDSNDEADKSFEEDMEVDEENSHDEEFFTLKKTSSVSLVAKDNEGRTALHYVAQTHPNGTFDNAVAAFVLLKEGAKLTTDAAGLNPYQLAIRSGALHVAEEIRKHFELQKEEPPKKCMDIEVNDGMPEEMKTWPDFKEASEKVLRRYDSSQVQPVTYIHEVDSNCNIKDGELLMDESQNIFYDVLMTKVDVKQGEWGLYNFYQMQLVSQPKKSLFVLFTRWGRIEDVGQYQHTPYASKEEAVKEFMKIFREKSGNKWTDVKNFERKANKYRLIEDDSRKAPPPQKEVEVNLESNVPSKLSKHLYCLIESLMNPKTIQMSISPGETNKLSLALGQLNKELLKKGKDILDKIELLVDEVEKYKQMSKDQKEEADNKTSYQNNLEKIAELSNEYFHVIPTRNFSYEKIRPLDGRNRLMAQIYNLSNLLDYEIATKMIFASMHYKTVYNPVDFVYHSVGCKIERMSQADEMSQMILKYITISSQPAYKVQGIYKLNREGESDRLKNTGLGDRRLLWHGTNTSNLLSILNRGLLICPPEAQMTGWAYGKGIYFSDAFAKSACYISSSTGSSSYMLLCEVALGEMLDFNKEQKKQNKTGIKGSKSEKTHNSVLVQVNNCAYSPAYWFHLPSGVSLPQNPMKIFNPYYFTQYIVLDPAQVCLRYLVEFTK